METQDKILLNMAINNTEEDRFLKFNSAYFKETAKARYKIYKQIHKEVKQDEM